MTREEAIKIIYCYDMNFYDLSGEKIPANKLAEAFDMAIESLSAEPKWTPCSDRLPSEHICDDGYVEPSEKVLVCTDSETILTSRYWGNRQSKAEDPDRYADWVDIDWWHNVVAWMPLPKPYKGGENE